MSKWIDFLELPTISVTKKFVIVSKENTTPIGYIKWYGAWRKYSFFPEANCVFETQCLKDIIEFLERLMTERKALKSKHLK